MDSVFVLGVFQVCQLPVYVFRVVRLGLLDLAEEAPDLAPERVRYAKYYALFDPLSGNN